MAHAHAVELIIGKQRIQPGIKFVFEGAVKDEVTPANYHLSVDRTHVHLEALANWARDESAPQGAIGGGFVPYLTIAAEVINEENGSSAMVDLVPHISLVDNLHYARNMSLPGKITDKYEVIFHIAPPGQFDLGFHKDWRGKYGEAPLFKPVRFRFQHVDFEAITRATRE